MKVEIFLKGSNESIFVKSLPSSEGMTYNEAVDHYAKTVFNAAEGVMWFTLVETEEDELTKVFLTETENIKYFILHAEENDVIE